MSVCLSVVVVVVVVVVVDDRFYLALFFALKQTHWAGIWFYMSVCLSGMLQFLAVPSLSICGSMQTRLCIFVMVLPIFRLTRPPPLSFFPFFYSCFTYNGAWRSKTKKVTLNLRIGMSLLLVLCYSTSSNQWTAVWAWAVCLIYFPVCVV